VWSVLSLSPARSLLTVEISDAIYCQRKLGHGRSSRFLFRTSLEPSGPDCPRCVPFQDLAALKLGRSVMGEVFVLHVTGADGQRLLPVGESIVSNVPYLQRLTSTNVGQKRKFPAEIEVSLPHPCSIDAFEAVLSRVSSRASDIYKTYFQWTLTSAATAVALIKTADFLLLPEIVTELVGQCRSCFVSLEDVDAIADLPHPKVTSLVDQMRGGRLATVMTKQDIQAMCQNVIGKAKDQEATALLKVFRQWLYDKKRTPDDVNGLACTVCLAAKIEQVPHIEILSEVSRHSHFQLEMFLTLIGNAFFDGDEYKQFEGVVEIAKVVIDCGVRVPGNFGNALSAVFCENSYTDFVVNRDRYLSCFNRFFAPARFRTKSLRSWYST